MVQRRTPKPTFYICDAIKSGALISKKIKATTIDDAMNIFETTYGVRAQVFHGPFVERQDRTLGTKEIVFSSQSLQAIYNDWKVKAILLKNPPNCAYLFFQERVDGEKANKPKGIFIVKCEDLIT